MEKRNDTNAAKENMADTRARLVKLENSFSLLLESDKCRIRGEIVREYRHFAKQGWIDEISLNYLNKQYEIYHKEGGNSYITGLMSQLNALPIGDMVAPNLTGKKQ